MIYQCLKNYTPIYPKEVTLFNEILSSWIFPEGWKLGHILLIHKKGPINEVNNYRDITLLYRFAKLFTKVINHRLCNWAEKYKVYLSGQAGFITKHSTNDNIFNLYNLVDAALLTLRKH